METAMFVSFYRSIVVFSLSHFERGELITFCVCPVVRCWNVVNAMTRQHSTLRYGRVINPFVFFSRPNAKQTTTTWNKHRKYKKKTKKLLGFLLGRGIYAHEGGLRPPGWRLQPSMQSIWPSARQKKRCGHYRIVFFVFFYLFQRWPATYSVTHTERRVWEVIECKKIAEDRGGLRQLHDANWMGNAGWWTRLVVINDFQFRSKSREIGQFEKPCLYR